MHPSINNPAQLQPHCHCNAMTTTVTLSMLPPAMALSACAHREGHSLHRAGDQADSLSPLSPRTSVRAAFWAAASGIGVLLSHGSLEPSLPCPTGLPGVPGTAGSVESPSRRPDMPRAPTVPRRPRRGVGGPAARLDCGRQSLACLSTALFPAGAGLPCAGLTSALLALMKSRMALTVIWTASWSDTTSQRPSVPSTTTWSPGRKCTRDTSGSADTRRRGSLNSASLQERKQRGAATETPRGFYRRARDFARGRMARGPSRVRASRAVSQSRLTRGTATPPDPRGPVPGTGWR